MYTPDRQINPDSFYERETESEKCHCQHCDLVFDLNEMARVRNGKGFYYLCSECIAEENN